jgi:hypothetical protein
MGWYAQIVRENLHLNPPQYDNIHYKSKFDNSIFLKTCGSSGQYMFTENDEPETTTCTKTKKVRLFGRFGRPFWSGIFLEPAS